MNTFAKKLRWLTTLSLSALMITALLAANTSAAVTWTSAVNSIWSTGSNWSSTSSPTTTDDVLFTGTGAVNTNTTTNEVDALYTTGPINSLWYQQQGETTGNYIHSTLIDSGQTLKIAGSVTNPLKGSNGPYSLIAGNFGSSQTMQSWTYISGPGELDVSAVGGGNTGGDIFVRETQGGSGGSDTAQLNLSGLATFNASVDQLLIGYANTYNGSADGERATGVMYLAQSNTITLNSPATGAGSSYATSVLNAGLYVGYTRHNANAATNPSVLYLGHTNVINVDDVIVGARRQVAFMLFNPAQVSGASLTMRGAAGGSSRVDQIVIGDNSQIESGAGTSDAKGTVDLTGATTVDILATSIILGRTPSPTTAATGRNANGTLTFTAGTIDTTGLIAGDEAGNWTTVNSGGTVVSATGNVNLSGTGHLIVGSTGMILGQTLGTTTSPATGNLSIAGGLVTMGADIMDGGGISSLSLTGGMIDMGGHLIGGISLPIDTVSLANGTVNNIAQINAGVLTIGSGATLGVSVSGPLTMGSTYDILNWVTESGHFDTVNLPALDPGLTWDSSKLYVDGTIQVVPEPAALLMLIMAAGLGLMFRRTRGK